MHSSCQQIICWSIKSNILIIGLGLLFQEQVTGLELILFHAFVLSVSNLVFGKSANIVTVSILCAMIV